MIFYFTGTGNSLYIAKRIAGITGDALISMNDKIKQNDTQPVHIENRLIFVVPTYGWRIPRVVERWIRTTQFTGAVQAWFVMDCGSEIGNAAKYIRRLCEQKSFFVFTHFTTILCFGWKDFPLAGYPPIQFVQYHICQQWA